MMSKPKQTDDKVIEELAKWLRFFDEYPTIKRAEELKADVEKLWGETVGANNEAPYLDWAKLFYTKLPSLGYEKVGRTDIVDRGQVIQELEEIECMPVHRKDCQCEEWRWDRSAICPTCTVKRMLAKLHSLGYRSPSEIRAIERDAVERVIEKVESYSETLFNSFYAVKIKKAKWQALKSKLLEQGK
jgi:hypothetical protein